MHWSAIAITAGVTLFAATVGNLLIPKAALAEDRPSLVLLLAYAVWVVYDIAWTFVLWRANRT